MALMRGCSGPPPFFTAGVETRAGSWRSALPRVRGGQRHAGSAGASGQLSLPSSAPEGRARLAPHPPGLVCLSEGHKPSLLLQAAPQAVGRAEGPSAGSPVSPSQGAGDTQPAAQWRLCAPEGPIPCISPTWASPCPAPAPSRQPPLEFVWARAPRAPRKQGAWG